MRLFVYIAYGLLIITFLILAGFSVRHALNYEYISSRVKPVTIIFVIVSLVLLVISVYFLIQLDI